MALIVGWIQVALMLGLPLGLGAWLIGRWRGSWRLFGFGALGFVASQVVHLPLLLVPRPASPWLLALWLGLLAGLCEETARFLVFRHLLKSARSFREGVLVGIGHGGIESMLLGGLVAISLVQAAALPASAPPELRALVQPVLEAPVGLRVSAVLERGMAMTCHVALSLIVLRGMFNRPLAHWGLAIAIHTALDAAAVRAAMTWGPAPAEIVVGVFALAAAMFIAFERQTSAARTLQTLAPATFGDAAIHCNALTRHFDQLVAVDGLDLVVPKGKCFALLGPNGAGKTTTVRMLAGLIAPSSGSARVAGCDISHDSDLLHGRVGILTEVPGLYERLTPLENLDLFGRLHGLDAARRQERARELLGEADLLDRQHDPVSTFSKGMKQKLAVMRSLMHEPDVVFLDEPTSGLDPQAAFELRKRIVDLKRSGRTIFLTTHRLEEAEELAELVGIFAGKLLALGTPSELRRSVAPPRLTVRLAELLPEHVSAIQAIEGVTGVEQLADRAELAVTLTELDATTPRIVSVLVGAGAAIREVTPVEPTLEEAYLALIARAGKDGA